MKFVCFDAFDQLPKSSDVLFAQAEKESMFFSRPWFENLVSTGLEDDQTLLLACVVEEEDVLAILPLLTRSNEECSSLHHLYTSLFTLLLAEKNQQDVLMCLSQGISQLPFNYLNLEPIAEDDSNINSLQQAMEAFWTIWQLALARVRNTIIRKQRKLERELGYEIRLHTTGSDIQQALSEYNKSTTLAGKHMKQFGDLLEGLATSFAKSGWIRLAILTIGDKPAAAQLWFVVDKKAYIFRLAYDEAWKQYSPGSILTKYLMEYVIDTDKVEEIDFLFGNDSL
ncbi:hypothetical protein GQR58_010621 [Nymphon striatum]|nr:hypothetical protein GQR58_010621 [Nymphon striatum]